MPASDLTILVAIGAGLISFLSPCVLPLVPAYLGQLTAVAVAGSAERPSRWLALRHSAAYVLGFGVVFTLLGVTATFVGGPLQGYLPQMRVVGGLILIVLGLNLAGILTIRALERIWQPMQRGAAGSLATMTGTVAFAPAGGGQETRQSWADRAGARLTAGGGLFASFGLGVIFAVGWTPCIGAILGSILTVAATSTTTLQGGVLLAAYTLGLGIPFLAMGFLYDRAPALLRPLVRHGRAVSVVGGMLVVGIGLAMVFNLLALLPQYFSFGGV